jgi:2,3-bisphosphoglycerate-dependent phosphoglycerate mutase
MVTFYLVRHAHADWTPDEDRPLSSRGSADALRIASVLRGYPIRAIYASPYQRARQTIAPLAAGLDLPVWIDPGLRERRLGDIAALDFFEAVQATWEDTAFAFPGGESNSAAQQRGLAVIRRLRAELAVENSNEAPHKMPHEATHEMPHIVLATHGVLIALILQAYDYSIDYAFWAALTMPDIYALHFDPAGEGKIRRLWPQAGGAG